MTVTVLEERIVLGGSCGVEEAETLLAALLDNPSRTVAIEADRLHTALWQVLMAIKPQIDAQPEDAFVSGYLLPLVLDAEARPTSPDTRKMKNRTRRSGQ
jgi:hypothetical protein